MSAVNPIRGRFLSCIPSLRMPPRRRNFTLPPAKNTPRHAQVDLSWAAEQRQATLSATADNTTRIQVMLNTLQQILSRTSSLRSYADKLRSAQDSSVDISQLSAYNAAVSEQISAFREKVETLQARQRHDTDPGALAAALEFAKMHVLKFDREVDLATGKGIQALRQQTNQRVKALATIETYLTEQIDKLQETLQERNREFDERYGLSPLDAPLARELAANTAEKILKRMDIILGIDATRQSSRIAYLLRHTNRSSY